MDIPLVRPGRVENSPQVEQVVAFFPNAAMANLAIQILIGLGAPSDRLGVTGPDRLERGQGMLLAVPCTAELASGRIEQVCQELGARIVRPTSS